MRNSVLICLVFILSVSLPNSMAQSVVITPSTATVVRDGKKFFEHTVEKGHTLYSIARAYNLSMEEIIRHNPSAEIGIAIGQKLYIPLASEIKQAARDTDDNQIELPADEAAIIYHVVRKGETLFAIARIYEVAVESIKSLNPGSEMGINEGERLRIPSAIIQSKPEKPKYTTTTYQTRRDENLQDIAKRFGVSVDDILQANPNLDLGIGRLRRGTELQIPQIDTAGTKVKATDTSSTALREEVDKRKPFARKPCKIKNDPQARYKIALLLPLYSRAVDGIQTDPAIAVPHEEHASFRFIQFYEGALLALDTLKQEGLNADFYVFDIDEDTNKSIRLLREQSLQGMDLIIGPLFSAPFQIIASYAFQNKIPIVNPLSQREEIVQGNPYVFKMVPAPTDRMKAIASFALEQYPEAVMHLIHRSVDREIRTADSFVTVLNEFFAVHQRDSNEINHITGSYVSASRMMEKMRKDRMNVIFTLSSDQVFVLNFLRNMTTLPKDYPFIIFGLPAWPEFTGMEPQYLLNLNIHMFANSWVDYSEQDVRQFVLAYRERYKAEPDAYAFQGYDVSRLFLTALLRYGREFPACLSQIHLPGLQSHMNFRHTEGDGYVNTFTHIFRYHEYKETDARKFPLSWP